MHAEHPSNAWVSLKDFSLLSLQNPGEADVENFHLTDYKIPCKCSQFNELGGCIKPPLQVLVLAHTRIFQFFFSLFLIHKTIILSD